LREIGTEDRDSNEQLAEIDDNQLKIAEAVKAGSAAYDDALKHEWAMLNKFLQFTNPVENIGSLEDNCPILLFPLRLETRFKKIDRDGETIDQLWVRVFPDDIAITV